MINVKNNHTKEQISIEITKINEYLLGEINKCQNCGGKCHEKSTN